MVGNLAAGIGEIYECGGVARTARREWKGTDVDLQLSTVVLKPWIHSTSHGVFICRPVVSATRVTSPLLVNEKSSICRSFLSWSLHDCLMNAYMSACSKGWNRGTSLLVGSWQCRSLGAPTSPLGSPCRGGAGGGDGSGAWEEDVGGRETWLA